MVVGPGESVVVGALGGEESGRRVGTDGLASGRRSGRRLLVIRAELVEDPARR